MIWTSVFDIISMCCAAVFVFAVAKVVIGDLRDYFAREHLRNEPWGDKWHDQWRNN